jgi:hypothetical protein
MTRVMTTFDPEVHGFRFRNQFQGGQVVSELSAQDRLAEQLGVSLPFPTDEVLSLVSGASFWGTFGLCGGMSWAALDHYLAGTPIPSQSTIPAQGTELFSRLVGRQADSLGRMELLGRVVTWQVLPDSGQWWRFWLDNAGKLVEHTEWPQLRASLEAGRPQSLCLIRSRGVGGIAKNHQVVATGYEIVPDGRVNIDLYDPNHPGMSPQISFQPGAASNRINPRQSTGEPLRGFFVWPHKAA